ncbi:MAG: phenylalanine--tRNA ligase subunit beta, partial [Clostridia bacterium]|nr:phenylalanine--tRNA ligase subunit beta [Clostridia bacterium]
VCGKPIGEAVIAGCVSRGMCCSEAELGIGADNSGLWEVPDEWPAGTPLKVAYPVEDILFEVDNKSLTNRPDLWGHYGIAREFATLSGRPLRAPALFDMTPYEEMPDVPIRIDAPDLCYRYTSVKVAGISRRLSPVAMRIRLYYCGSRSINFAADLTNYVMMELGQPMHAFDLRRVSGIEVRCLPSPTPFVTLDGVERVVDENTLMITSGGEPVAIAGIMGGQTSEVEDDTSALLIESANFNAVSVRKSSARLGLRTDASMRYEKTLDPEMTETAARRLLRLLFESDPGARVVSRMTDLYPTRFPRVTLEIDRAYVDRYTGISISPDEIERTLVSLGFGVSRMGDAFRVEVPTFRATKDVTIKADLIEEITRIYGYDNFEIKTTVSPLYPVRPAVAKTDENRAKDLLVLSFGLHEVHSYIWSDAAKDKELGIRTADNVRLLNAQTPDHAILRRSMIPSLLAFVKENKGWQERFGLFEIGHVVDGLADDGTCRERKRLGVVLCDRTNKEEAAFLEMRDLVVYLLRQLRGRTPTFAQATETPFGWEHPVNCFSILADGREIGRMGVFHPEVRDHTDRKAALCWLEIDMADLADVSDCPLRYRAPSRYPAIECDLCFAGDLSRVDFAQVKAAAKDAAGELLAGLCATDVYEDEAGRTVTLRLTFASDERTLSRAELTGPIDAVVAALAPLGLTFRAV